MNRKGIPPQVYNNLDNDTYEASHQLGLGNIENLISWYYLSSCGKSCDIIFDHRISLQFSGVQDHTYVGIFVGEAKGVHIILPPKNGFAPELSYL